MKKIILIILFLASVHLNSQWVSNYWANCQGDSPILNSKGLAVTVDDDNYCYVTGYTYSETLGYDIILIKYTPAGDTVFTQVYSGTGNEEDKAFGIVVDQAGNIYITGQLSITGRSTDLVLLKYNNSGNLLWAQTYGATTTEKADKGAALVLDDEGNIYVTGFCTGEDGYTDLLVQKYNAEGSLLWTRREDGDANMDSEGNGIAIGDEDCICVTGYTTSINNANKKDVITLKYSFDGVLNWLNIYDGEGNNDDIAYGIAAADDGVYVTGYTTPGNDASNTSTLLIKYGNSGSLKWIKTFESGIPGSEDKAFGIVVDSDNRIYITGQVQTVTNSLDYLAIKYGPWSKRTPVIEEKWISSYNGPGNGVDIANAIDILPNGKIVVTGASWGDSSNFDYATVVMNKNSGSINEIYRYGKPGNYNDVAKDVKCSSNNRIYVTGYSELRIDSPGEAPSTITTLSLVENEYNTNINVPMRFNLYQNYPNPFNPSTTIKFDLSAKSDVKLVVYDMLGRTVCVLVNNNLDAGSYNITYNNINLSSGIYFYQLTAGNYKDAKKMTLVK
jgi:uncharacterized delta-60 repeat protein